MSTLSDALATIADLAIEALAAVLGHVVVIACGLIVMAVSR